MKRFAYFVVLQVALLLLSVKVYCVDISLAGEWRYQVDSLSIGVEEHWENREFHSTITLPGSTDEAGVGNSLPLYKSRTGYETFSNYPAGADFGMFTRKHKYIGKVWYQREFDISNEQAGCYTLFLERVMWRSMVWIDGKLVSSPIDYLSSPHVHHLGNLSEGNHTITIMVDNSEIYPIGALGHSYCPHMQTQWNGIVGKIGLNRDSEIMLAHIDAYPSYEKQSLKLSLEIINSTSSVTDAIVNVAVRKRGSAESVASYNQSVNLVEGKSGCELNLRVVDVLPWDEFTPNLYDVDVRLSTGKYSDTRSLVVGFRDLSYKDKHFSVNGKKITYRNSHEGMFFAKTGYPAMDVEYWRRVWTLYKNHGFNAVRFHSACPPEAAFVAADELGLYLQVEFFWKDGWMNLGDLIGGKDERLNNFVYDEALQALRCYGNHPSMMLVSFGNELGGNFDWMGERIRELKEFDPRHLYAAGIAHNITIWDDYVEYGGKNKAHNYDGTDWDYSHNYKDASAHNYDKKEFRREHLPEFTHEAGQYIVHPLWRDIESYDGVLAPYNMQYYHSVAVKNGIANLDEELQYASGRINKNLYKAEIEATLRTKESAGYALLSMVDYPGQGEALVGWVNALYESKNFMTPEEYRMFGSHTVPLLRFAKFVWTDGERFEGKVEVANYGAEDLIDLRIHYKLSDGDKLLSSGVLESKSIPQGELTSVGSFGCTLKSGKAGRKVDIEVSIENTSYVNRWSVWVFPDNEKEKNYSSILQTHSLQEAITALKAGRKVLLYADNLGSRGNGVYSSFYPVFWSATWFMGQDTDVSGAYVRNTHPMFDKFPTENVIDWQWRDICEGSHGFVLNDLPADYYPVV